MATDIQPDVRRLPSGRHGLPRRFVVKHQRDRITAAVIASVSDIGYVAMTIEDVVQRAAISRRTFYDHFSDKEEAFLVAYDGISERLFGAVLDASVGRATPEERLTAGVRAFLELWVREPAFADTWIVAVLAAGPEVLARRDRSVNAFAALLDEVTSELADPRLVVPPLVAETLVGGIYAMTYQRVVRGETEHLADLLPQLVHFCLLPYVGSLRSRAVCAELCGGRAA